MAAGAFDGAPASYGGWGSYSMPSWMACAISTPWVRPTSVSARSMPGRHAGGGDDLAFDHDPLLGRAARRSARSWS